MNSIIPIRAQSGSLLLAALVAPAASAGFTPAGCSISVTSSAGAGTVSNTVATTSPTTWAATGTWAAGGASVAWTNCTQGWNDATGTGFTSGNFVLRNFTSAAQDFTVTISMDGTADGPMVASGSGGGQFVNASTGLGSLTSVGPLWSGIVDGNTVRGEFNNTLAFAQPFQILSLGNFNFSGVSVASGVGESLSIRFNLRMSASSEASFTSVLSFQEVPAPGCIALLGIAPAFTRRRRQRVSHLQLA